MIEQKDWLDSIRKLPDWLKAAIGFVTLVIGFVVLFQKDLNLSVVVTISLGLLGMFGLGTYLAFSKKDSAIIGGGRVYRFPNHRRWALVAVILIPVLVIALLATEPVRNFVAIAFVGTKTSVPTATATLTPAPAMTATLAIAQGQLASVISSTDPYASPDPNGVLFFPRHTIPAGTIVQVLSIKDNWAKIRVRRGTYVEIGWLPLNVLDLSITPTPTPIPSADSVRLSFRNPNGQNVLVIIGGPAIGEMEIEVSAGTTASVYLPAGSYTYQVYKEYVSPGAPPSPTPKPEPGLCAHYQSQTVLVLGERQTIEILSMTTEQGEPFFARCPQPTPTP